MLKERREICFWKMRMCRYMFADQWGVRIGQFKGPGDSREAVSDKRLVNGGAVDAGDAILGGGYEERVQGVTGIFGGYRAISRCIVEIGLTMV